MLVESTLARLGFNPKEATSLSLLSPEKRYQKLKSNLEGYELHTARDQAVSIPNFYYLGPERKIYTNKSRADELPIDEEERGGLYRLGIAKAIAESVNNPSRLVFLYSPPGPASFSDKTNKYSTIDYDIGQLYLMYFDGEKTNCISVSIDKNGEGWLSEVFGDYYNKTKLITDQAKQISQFITVPFISDLTVDEFLDRGWYNPSRHIFLSKSDEEHSLQNILLLIRESITGHLRGKLNTDLLAAKLAYEGGSISEGKLYWAYQEINRRVMKERGLIF